MKKLIPHNIIDSVVESFIAMADQLMNGKDFNEQYGGRTLIKLTNRFEIEGGLQFKTGHNASKLIRVSFYLQENMISELCSLGFDDPMMYLRTVTIPDEAQVKMHPNGVFLTDQLILGDRRAINQLEVWQDPAYCLAAVKQNYFALNYMDKQTPEVCLAAVENDRFGWALRYIKKQTPAICLAACRTTGNALEYVKRQTPEICIAACQSVATALGYVEKQTPEICLAAVLKDGRVLRYVKKPTQELCAAALDQMIANSVLMDHPPEYVVPRICLAAVLEDGRLLRYLKKPTQEICSAVLDRMIEDDILLDFDI